MFKSLRFAPFVLMAASAVELTSEVGQKEKLAKVEEVNAQSLSSLLDQVEVTLGEVSIFSKNFSWRPPENNKLPKELQNVSCQVAA